MKQQQQQISQQLKGLISSNPRVEHLFEDVIYIRKAVAYYHKKEKAMFKINELCDITLLKKAIIEDFRLNELIDEYSGIIFSQDEKPGYYNLFSRKILLEIGEKPEIDENIAMLLDKVSGGDENKQYLEKLILFKYYNPTDYTIPALILHGNGGIGKGQFCKMLGNIFGGSEYCSLGLGQEALIGNFSYYKGDKLIVEFAEIYSHDTHQDKIVMNKLKNMIGQDTIHVNEKFKAPYEINNPALFIITSNYEKPVHFDSGTGNRRFSVMKSTASKMTVQEGVDVNKVIHDKEKLSNFLCYLEHKRGKEVRSIKGIRALDNEDKRALTQASMSDAQRFWKRLSDNHYDKKIAWKDLTEGPKDGFGVSEDSIYMKQFLEENTDVDSYQLKKWLSKECPFTRKMIYITDTKKTGYGIHINRKFEE